MLRSASTVPRRLLNVRETPSSRIILRRSQVWF
jgi:hypothetical protein